MNYDSTEDRRLELDATKRALEYAEAKIEALEAERSKIFKASEIWRAGCMCRCFRCDGLAKVLP